MNLFFDRAGGYMVLAALLQAALAAEGGLGAAVAARVHNGAPL